jgi:hypothetical protein
VLRFAERFLREVDREGLDGLLHCAGHERDHRARIHAAAQEGAEGDIADQADARCLVELVTHAARPVGFAHAFLGLEVQVPVLANARAAGIACQQLAGAELADALEHRER